MQCGYYDWCRGGFINANDEQNGVKFFGVKNKAVLNNPNCRCEDFKILQTSIYISLTLLNSIIWLILIMPQPASLIFRMYIRMVGMPISMDIKEPFLSELCFMGFENTLLPNTKIGIKFIRPLLKLGNLHGQFLYWLDTCVCFEWTSFLEIRETHGLNARVLIITYYWPPAVTWVQRCEFVNT